MSDYFQRLAARTLGLGAMIEPIPSDAPFREGPSAFVVALEREAQTRQSAEALAVDRPEVEVPALPESSSPP